MRHQVEIEKIDQEPTPIGDIPTSALVARLMTLVATRVQEQLGRARVELDSELRRVVRAALLLGTALAVGMSGVALVIVGLASSLVPGRPLVPTVGGLVLLLLAGGTAYAGYRRLPQQPMSRTQEEVREELEWIRDQVE